MICEIRMRVHQLNEITSNYHKTIYAPCGLASIIILRVSMPFSSALIALANGGYIYIYMLNANSHKTSKTHISKILHAFRKS